MPELYLVPLGTKDSDRGDQAGAIVIFDFPCVVGRSPACDRRVANRWVSGRHCAFSWRHGRVWVEDLGSRHGTHLNGERLTDARPLWGGEVLRLAHLSFRVRLDVGLASGTGSGLGQECTGPA
jgi:pSer/pThr/pTyr-binding forkhead associated (FHA) protein